ncbi:MAG: electron transfer flavoprotein-ubiquinone oxidoreductase [Gammaproteobacteria bacterium]|nr:electron transfer flavoprotein-ubiquinone oxidoreductase [Gammaproteobacteria bacterium]MDE0444329.1 electron transfer flavoprotein-ubiquinone oxidoreductase [Gammaproteobacteria bacterium]
MEFDVVIVGGGPSGLATACRLMQLGVEAGVELNVCLVEKGSEIGAHILSGAVLHPKALNELFPDAAEQDAPLGVPVTDDLFYYLVNDTNRILLPSWVPPKETKNKGNYTLSLGNLCRWLGEQAENMGVNVFPGFAASEILFADDGSVKGVATSDMGVGANGEPKPTFEPGYELHAKYTVFAEGCRGHLGKQLIAKFNLAADAGPQHYGIGLKELWDVDPERHVPGRILHNVGWPLGRVTSPGTGSFLYHQENNQVALGIIVDLAYRNPHLSPFDELQRLKHHPLFADVLRGGRRVAYGARAVVKGGLQALPKLTVPGAVIVGDDAGFLNMLKIKGTHTAMKSGMLAAESVFDALQRGEANTALDDFRGRVDDSWLGRELRQVRNVGPALHKFGTLFGMAYTFVDQKIARGRMPFTLRDTLPDHDSLKPVAKVPRIHYPKPDGVLSFDKLSSVFLSNTNHEEDQPCHLTLADAELPIRDNLPLYDEPAQRYCPAGVYEVVEEADGPRFQINAQNCVHCKTCDIKDPAQNINWVTPEGAGGPNYGNM